MTNSRPGPTQLEIPNTLVDIQHDSQATHILGSKPIWQGPFNINLYAYSAQITRIFSIKWPLTQHQLSFIITLYKFYVLGGGRYLGAKILKYKPNVRIFDEYQIHLMHIVIHNYNPSLRGGSLSLVLFNRMHTKGIFMRSITSSFGF